MMQESLRDIRVENYRNCRDTAKSEIYGRISSLSEILENLKETGFWLNEDLRSKILRYAGEL